MNIKLVKSVNVKDFKPIFEGLIDDFGYIYYHAILSWCGIIDRRKEKFWEVWLIKWDNETIGICGLYSQRKGDVSELWLGWFGILPDYRNCGLGAKVLGLMEKKAAKLGCERIYSYVDADGAPLPFYYRNGFKRVCSVKTYLKKNRDLTMEDFESADDHVIMKQIKTT